MIEYCIGKNGNVGIHCPHCHKVVELPISEERLLSWDGSDYIQNHFPELSPSQREMILSGLCSECWDKLILEEDEE